MTWLTVFCKPLCFCKELQFVYFFHSAMYPVVWLYLTLFIHSSIAGHLGCIFLSLFLSFCPISNCGSINIFCTCLLMYMCRRLPLRYIPTTGILGSWRIQICNLRQHQLFSNSDLYRNVWKFSLFHLFSNLGVITASPVAHTVNNLPVMQETQLQPLGWEDPLEKGMAAHSSILAWRIPQRRLAS